MAFIRDLDTLTAAVDDDDSVGAVVLTGGVEGRFLTHADPNETGDLTTSGTDADAVHVRAAATVAGGPPTVKHTRSYAIDGKRRPPSHAVIGVGLPVASNDPADEPVQRGVPSRN